MSKLLNISCVVILHKPDFSLTTNIATYYDYIDDLFLWRNSEIDSALESSLNTLYGDKIIWCGDNSNYGIGTALNFALSDSASKRAKWLLTMDQDSYFELSSINILKENIIAAEHNVAIISANHSVQGEFSDANKSIDNTVEINDWVMMSGNFVNVELAHNAGGFNNDLFIDGVDIEFCQRILNLGYKIILIKDSVLFHVLGQTQIKYLFKKKFLVTNYAPIRLYYIYRNHLYIIFKLKINPLAKKILIHFLLHKLFCIMFFEKDKLNKLFKITIGFRDFFVQGLVV